MAGTKGTPFLITKPAQAMKTFEMLRIIEKHPGDINIIIVQNRKLDGLQLRARVRDVNWGVQVRDVNWGVHLAALAAGPGGAFPDYEAEAEFVQEVDPSLEQCLEGLKAPHLLCSEVSKEERSPKAVAYDMAFEGRRLVISLPNDKELGRLLEALKRFQQIQEAQQHQGPVPISIRIFVDEADVNYPQVEKLLLNELPPVLIDLTKLYLVTATPLKLLELVDKVEVCPNTINLDNYIGFRNMRLEYRAVPHSHRDGGITGHLKAMYAHLEEIGEVPEAQDYLFVPGYWETATHWEVAKFLATKKIASTVFNKDGERDMAHAFAVVGNKCVGRGVTIHDDDLPLSIVLLAAGIETDRRQSQVSRAAALYQISARAAGTTRTGEQRPILVVTTDKDLFDEVCSTEAVQMYLAEEHEGELDKKLYKKLLKEEQERRLVKGDPAAARGARRQPRSPRGHIHVQEDVDLTADMEDVETEAEHEACHIGAKASTSRRKPTKASTSRRKPTKASTSKGKPIKPSTRTPRDNEVTRIIKDDKPTLQLLLKRLQTSVRSRDIAERAVVQFVERFTKRRPGDAHFYIAGIPRIRNVPDAVKELAKRAVKGLASKEALVERPLFDLVYPGNEM